MAKSKYEIETTIRWDAETNIVTEWTCDPREIRKMDKLVQQCPDVYTFVTEDKWGGRRYSYPAKMLRRGKPRSGRPENADAFRERMAAYRASKNEIVSGS